MVSKCGSDGDDGGVEGLPGGNQVESADEDEDGKVGEDISDGEGL